MSFCSCLIWALRNRGMVATAIGWKWRRPLVSGATALVRGSTGHTRAWSNVRKLA